jgi:hypothetical protein
VARHNYRNAEKEIVYQAARRADGSRIVRCPDPKDPTKWRFGRAKWGVAPLPYRLPDLLEAGREASWGAGVWIVPAEEDADALWERGIPATCTAREKGRDGWMPEWNGWLEGFQLVVVVCGRDRPGRGRLTVQRALADRAETLRAEQARAAVCASRPPERVRCMRLPEIAGREPAGPAEWFDLGGTAEGLRAAARSAPPWEPPDALGMLLDAGFAEGEIREALHGGSGGGADAGTGGPAQGGPAAAPSPAAGGGGAPPPSPAPPPEKAAPVGGAGTLPDDDPRSVAALRGAFVAAYGNSNLDKNSRQKVLEAALMEWLARRGRLYYNLEAKTESTSLYFDAVTKTLYYTGRDAFKAWLSVSTQVNAASATFKLLLARVASEALAGSATRGIVPEKYWCRKGNAVYVSCGDGRVVRCTPEGAATVDNGTDGVLFLEGHECAPWTLLEGGGENPFARCTVFSGMKTVKRGAGLIAELWCASMPLHPGMTKPVLLLAGKGRGGKTMVARMIQRLYGIPDRAQMIDRDYKMDNFWTAADSGGMFCLDNADQFVPWLNGCLCTVATGASYTKRMHYKDTELVTQRARCWVAVTGVRPYFAADFTVADRLLPVEILPRGDKATRDEGDLSNEVDEARDAGLTWLCRAWCRALADRAEPPAGMNPRHPGWARTAWRLARAIGCQEEAEALLGDTQQSKAVFSLRNDALGEFLVEAFGATGFKGSMTDMHEALTARCEGFDGEKWTKVRMGKALKDHLQQNLESAFGLTWPLKNHGGIQQYALAALPPSLQSPTMWGVEGVSTFNAVTGGGARAPDPSPPTPPTSQNLLGGEGERETEGAGGPRGPAEDSGWDAL